jgi:hypothetical protein
MSARGTALNAMRARWRTTPVRSPRRGPNSWSPEAGALAAHGRGTDIPTLTAELKRLRSEGERLEHLGALSAIDAALAARPASAPADEVHALRL